MNYKFAVKGYFIENSEVWGSKFQTKGMVHPDFEVKYFISGRCKVRPLHFHCDKDLEAILLEEGPNIGRVAFALKSDVRKIFQ